MIIFKTYYNKGRKYCKFGKETILMEPSVKDKVERICGNHFKKFKLRFYNTTKPTFMLYLTKNVDTVLFEESVDLEFGKNIYYDIIRVK